MNDILTIHKQARQLAEIHGTGLDYELDRKAREHDHSDWLEMLKSQPSHLPVALGLQQQWLRPATRDDGDVGGWPIVPTYNPLLSEYLPSEGPDRNTYIHAIATLLVTSSTTRHLIERDKDYASRLAAAFIRLEVNDALKEDRPPSLFDGGVVLRTLEERVRAQAAISKGSDSNLAKVLLTIADERRDSDPEGAMLLEEIARTGLGWSLSILDNTRRAFLRFRNPAIARLVA